MVAAAPPVDLDAAIVLDPAVWIEELAARPPAGSRGPAARRGWLLVHDALEAAAVLPPGRGLLDFVEGLRAPTRLGDLVTPDEIASEALAWRLLAGLTRRGFAHRLREARAPDERDLAALRAAWRAGQRHARPRLRVTSPAAALAARLGDATRPPALELACGEEAATLAALRAAADALARAGIRAHEIVVELPPGPCGAALRAELRRHGARARLRAGGGAVDGELALALARAHVAVAVRAEAGPDPLRGGRLAELARAVTAARAGALELEVAWAELERSAPGHDPGALAAELCGRVRELADALGDVRIVGLPGDDEIVQDALADAPGPASEVERAARRLHLAERARYLAGIEGRSVWAQDPAAEELWVPTRDDLLPRRPELLDLGEGAVIADIGGGLGRVARRLAPLVGAAGLVISIDKQPLYASRARRLAAELGARSIRFDVGLGQRVPLADASVDAAVLEWGGEIHRDGLLGACIAEMRRIVRPGRHIAITYRLCNVRLDRLDEVFAPAPDIYPALLAAVAAAGLTVLAEELWVVRPQLSGAPMAAFEERFLPRLLDDLGDRRLPAQPPAADLTLTVVAQA